MTSTPDTCRKCGAAMEPGIAIEQTYTGSPDFPGHEVVTLSPGGPGRVIECVKCSACGWSVTTRDQSTAKEKK